MKHMEDISLLKQVMKISWQKMKEMTYKGQHLMKDR